MNVFVNLFIYNTFHFKFTLCLIFLKYLCVYNLQSVVPMILDCGLIELVQNVVTLRSVIINCYETIGIKVSTSTLKGLVCSKHIFNQI